MCGRERGKKKKRGRRRGGGTKIRSGEYFDGGFHFHPLSLTPPSGYNGQQRQWQRGSWLSMAVECAAYITMVAKSSSCR